MELTAQEELTIWENCRDRGCACDRPRLVPYGGGEGPWAMWASVRIEHRRECPLWRDERVDDNPHFHRAPDATLC